MQRINGMGLFKDYQIIPAFVLRNPSGLLAFIEKSLQFFHLFTLFLFVTGRYAPLKNSFLPGNHFIFDLVREGMSTGDYRGIMHVSSREVKSKWLKVRRFRRHKKRLTNH